MTTRFLITVVAALLLSACSKQDAPPEYTAPKAGVPAQTLDVVDYPVFTMNDMDGNPREFAEWQGRHRLLNFWATWCAPCRREIPLLKEFQDEQGDDGILVMGIAVDFPEDVARYAAEAEFNYPILVGQEDAMALAESSGVEFIAMPFTMIVARDGRFLSAYLGELHREQLDTINDVLARLDNGDIDSDAAGTELDSL